ncbi:DEAD/DEAH box helicase (plasmid) [Rhodovastum atsumiense]|uniref:DEAD/DEAH box helicase n=1 Tax=Rhodovastum atsumiense TaxID=504468 RepID=A0A5M6IVD1_9PROT|nr:DEAD/DEAH box helicase [Rhodovastum atsumiense]KAA5611899.1 DEAD/DEAH box helicase [Rhodovastum atsumiense]CAH2606120.1 DEAD/DEAH box helicase [Rhodovastum atsumiense]
MQVGYNEHRARWEATTKYGTSEGDAARSAGMAWDRTYKVWWTRDAEAAKALRDGAADPVAESRPVVLVFSEARNRWEARTKYGCGDAAREAGLHWDRERKLWFTDDASVANKLRAYADEATQARLDAETAQVRHAIEASRAQSADIELPIAEGRSYLPYQRAGIAFALARQNTLFGDDMGLGKTAQAIGVVNADESLKRILVICPASLTRNWVREFGMFGSRTLSVGIADMKTVPAADVVVATYDAFSRKTATAEALRAVEWDALILDEAHYLKSKDAARTVGILGGKKKGADQAVEGIRARRRLYLTGTPLTNRPVELWPLVHSLAPATFGDFWSFARRYCDARNDGYGWNFNGASHLDELQDLLRQTVMVRRLKKDVLTELPPKRRQIIELPADAPALKAALTAERKATEEEARIKEQLAELRAKVELAKASEDPRDYERAVAALQAGQSVPLPDMSRVRHETAVAKAPLVADHVREAVEAGGKVIVFAHHKDVVDLLKSALADLGVVVLTGDTPPAKRQDAVDAFQNCDDIRVFIGNIQAAGVGITLTASAHVVFAELDWVPGNLSQAEDRAWRLGQRNAVLVQHIVLEGSLDATMAATVTGKQRVIDAALDKIQDPEERARRIAEEQARIEAAVQAGAASDTDTDDAGAARAATADSTPEDVAAVAAALSPEAVAAIHAGLRILAGLDRDGAREINGVGFNRLDTVIGRKLAMLDVLTARQAALGQKLVRRYRRQLPADLLAVALGEAVAPATSRIAKAEPPVETTAAVEVEAAPAPEATSEPEDVGPAEAAVERPQGVGPDASAPAAAVTAEPGKPPIEASPGMPLPATEEAAEVEAEAVALPEPSAGGEGAAPASDAARMADDAPEIPVPMPFLAAPPATDAGDQPGNPEGGESCEPADAAPLAAALAPTDAAPAAPRRRGRPPKGDKAMSDAERARAWREGRAMGTAALPVAVLEQIRELQAEMGGTTGDIITAALAALARERAAARGQRAA